MFMDGKVKWNKEIITTDMALKAGMSKFKFYKFLKENGYEQVGHGIYAAGDAWIDELLVLHLRCPQGVFSHDEAFYHYGLTDREPMLHTLTMYSGYNSHRLTADGCKVYTVKKDLLNVGKIYVRDNCGNDIPMYDLERTMCDLVRNRNSIEVNEFNTAMKSYVSKNDKDLNRLMSYAKLFRVDKIMRKYMEVLL
jgi:predicted transcriptional regulator of viral defense system